MSDSQKRIATLQQAANRGNSRLNYTAIINGIKSLSYPERVFWLMILLCLAGGVL